MQNHNIKRYVGFVLVFFCSFLLIGIGLLISNEKNKFVYEKHLEDWIIACGEDTLSLKDFGYYILLMERDTQETAYQYDASQPMNYWNLYIGTDGKIGYVNNLSKEYAVAYALRDFVYARQMEQESFAFTSEQLQTFYEDASLLSESFSKEQLDAVGMNEQEFIDRAVYVAKVHVYIESLISKGISAQELEIEGSYYQNIVEQYCPDINQELVTELKFGQITVNW